MSYDRVKNSGNTAIYLNPSTLIKFLLRVLKEPRGGTGGPSGNVHALWEFQPCEQWCI